MSQKVEAGDWVRSYSKGIWQVVRRIPDHYEVRYLIDSPKVLVDGPLFLLKRILDGNGKPKYAMEVAHANFAKPISKAEKQKLERALKAAPNLLPEFQSFDQPVNAIWNLGVGLPKRSQIGSFKREMSKLLSSAIQEGITGDAVLGLIASTPCADRLNELPISAMLQFISPNYEVHDQNLVYRQFNVQVV